MTTEILELIEERSYKKIRENSKTHKIKTKIKEARECWLPDSGKKSKNINENIIILTFRKNQRINQYTKLDNEKAY